MGYTTNFEGNFHLNNRLFDSEVLYLLAFSGSRRVKRDVTVLQNLPDPAREAVALPLGEQGSYFVNDKWIDSDSDNSILDYNRPPSGQPGLWCQWVPTFDGRGIEWDGNEKFYKYIEWLQYIINNFLNPWGYLLSGEVNWQGESMEDKGIIKVENNQIIYPEGAELLLKEAVSPVQVSLAVWQGLEAVKTTDTPLMLWHRTMDKASELGYSETAAWMKSNIEKYANGLKRGFEAEGKVIECSDVIIF